MPIQIKDVGTLSTKFANRAANAAPDYKAGVMTPRRSQSQSAVAAAGTWQASVASAGALARFKARITAAGDAGWQAGVIAKGADRYAPGVRAGQTKWANNVGPYLQVIAGLNLPPRGIRGSDANIQRVSAVATALHAKKVAASGGS